MQKNKKNIIGVSILAGLLIVLGLVYFIFIPKSSAGSKSIVIETVLPDKKTKEYKIKTDEEFLGAVLASEKIASGEKGAYGLFIKTVGGVTVDDSKQEWWCFTKNGGETINTAPDATPIADGEKYEITFTVGY